MLTTTLCQKLFLQHVLLSERRLGKSSETKTGHCQRTFLYFCPSMLYLAQYYSYVVFQRAHACLKELMVVRSLHACSVNVEILRSSPSGANLGECTRCTCTPSRVTKKYP